MELQTALLSVWEGKKMETEKKLSAEEALEMMKFNLKQFPRALLALNGTWGECIRALEKQIPKKPKYQSKMPKCPSCDKWIDNCTINAYCYHCGQALDWSDENA